MHCSIPKPAPIDVCRCWAERRRLLSATAVATWRSQWPSAVVGGACLVPGLVWMVNDRAKNVYRSTVRPRLVTANAHTCCSSDGLTYYPHAPHRQMQAATVGGRIGSAFCAVSRRTDCRVVWSAIELHKCQCDLDLWQSTATLAQGALTLQLDSPILFPRPSPRRVRQGGTITLLQLAWRVRLCGMAHSSCIRQTVWSSSSL